MDIIGQNGNDGLHYDAENKKEEPKKIVRILQRTPTFTEVLYEDGSKGRLRVKFKGYEDESGTIKYM